MLAVVLASCGSMWNLNWAPQVNCTVAKNAGIYWGKKYINCWSNRFLIVQKYIYIYIKHIHIYIDICIYDPEQTVVILQVQHFYFPDQQG